MKVTFCGGAGEVGASCYLIEVAGKRILLDCGLRMGAARDPLPDLRLIQDQGVDAIILSHAHLDHSGALPLISREYPLAPIFMTHATADLVRVLLYDSLRIMDNEGEIPIYAEKHVEQMLERIVCLFPQTPLMLPRSEIQLSFHQAGHILGAGCVELKSSSGSLFYSGDISFARQLTVNGASIGKLRPDVAIFESTYGDKLHANRQGEEERLAETVGEVIERGGKVLIPAFALGRAQEVILILQRAMNKGTLPKCPVWVDGMVRDICRVYKLNPNYLPPSLAKRVWRDGEIFFNEEIQPVPRKPQAREEIAKSKDPCIIISSSGMLSGGPSQYYAEQLIGSEDNLIVITGYQDEEAPGRALLNLMETQQERKIQLGERVLPVVAKIEKYNLSAHADRGELIGLAHVLAPKKLFLVHGEPTVTEELAKNLQAEIWGQVEVPSNGQIIEPELHKPRKQKQQLKLPSLQKGQPPGEEELELLWEHLLDHDHTFPTSPQQLLLIWQGSSSQDEARELGSLLAHSPYFQQDPKRPFLFSPLPPEKIEQKQEDGPLEMNQMLALVDEYFPPQSGLYKKGARLEEGQVILTFKFPRLAREQYKTQFAQFASVTGWEVELNENTNLQAAQEVLRGLLPSSVQLLKFSYFPEEDSFRAQVSGEVSGEIALDFLQMTGHALSIEYKQQQELKIQSTTEPLEQNQALALIEQAFLGEKYPPHKKSLKQDEDGRYIELSFITPQVGAGYRELLDKLECQTLWRLKLGSSVNQLALLSLARSFVEKEGGILKKNPSYLGAQAKVRISLEQPPKNIEKLEEEFFQETGFHLELGS